jgi:uncharacterized membrane protein
VDFICDKNTGQIKIYSQLIANEKLILMATVNYPPTNASTCGYSYVGGLIGEAHRVLYGVPSDITTYPGVIAAGASVNISSPSIRRISVGLAVRLRTGFENTAVFEAIRSGIATYVNGLGVGSSVPLSNIVSIANSVDGVFSVVITNPTYNTTSDSVVVRVYEKAMIQDPVNDISIISAGTS